MQKRLIALAVIGLISFHSFSQSSLAKYQEDANNIRKDIWNWDMPEFKQRSVPAEYANASRVVLARHLEVNADSKRKMSFRTGLRGYRELMLSEVLREAVKVNDKSALSDYSEISYTQLEKQNSFIIDKTTIVYVGIRVIKPDGSVKEINGDEIILTKNQSKRKEAKIAVPDLQIGDIIDYFIARQTNMSEVEKIPPYIFTFYDDVPMLHASMHIEAGKKYALEYRSYNGAPDLKATRGEDNENILDVAKKNIPAMSENSLWTAPYRQLPMVRLNILVGAKGLMAGANARRPGELYKNQETDEYVEDKLRMISYYRLTNRLNFGLGKTSSAYMKKLLKNRDNMSEEDFARELFYIFRYNNFLEAGENNEISDIIAMPKTTFDENLVTYFLGEFLKAHDVDNYFVYATLNKGPRMKEILSADDLNNIIKLRSGKNSYYGFSNIFTCPGYLPNYFENTSNALLINTRGSRETNISKFDRTSANIPASASEDNTRIEKLQVSLSNEAAYLDVKRQSTLRGHYKADEQQRLILMEDYYNAERKLFNEDQTIIEKLSERKKTKNFAGELESAFAEARKKNKESFEQEAKSFFDQEIKDLANYKVENMGTRHTAPDFVYSSQFKFGSAVKKAGNSYIIDIGKLQGNQLKLEGSSRKRTLDVYSPFSRSLQYEINFVIPDGYTVEGVSALNKNVSNASGGFTCEASATDKLVTVKVKKVYKNIYEPAKNWENMIAFIDAANEWGNSKIILKKK